MSNLTDNRSWQIATYGAMAYLGIQAAIATVRTAQIAHSAVKEYRSESKKDES